MVAMAGRPVLAYRRMNGLLVSIFTEKQQLKGLVEAWLESE
jgi:hypothetical protein